VINSGQLGGDAALMLRFESVETCQSWTDIIRRIINKTHQSTIM